MIEFVHKYAHNYSFSQNGEEGILIECLRRMDIEQGHCVEIGANNGTFCSNTALLVERGFSGKMVEADWGLYQQCLACWKHNPKVTVQCSRVDGTNVNAFVDDSCDVFSSDTDGADYEIFKGLKAKPKTVIVEIDSGIPPDMDAFNSDGGAGYNPMVALGMSKGYFLLCHTGNLIFIDEQYRYLFSEAAEHPLFYPDLYFNRGWIKAA